MSEKHVVPDRVEVGWKVVGANGGGETRAATQAEAIDEAVANLRRDGGGDLLIHGLSGAVQDRRTVQYG